MKIGLVDVDNWNKLNKCFPNLPMMKLSAYHKSIGDDVEWHDMWTMYDRVYMSKVFSFTPDYPKPISTLELLRGGSGYCISVKDGKEQYDKSKDTELPYHIEHIMPDYSLYGITDTAYGFMSRGCPRGCDFCHVKTKEGLISRKVADLSEFWDGQEYIQLMDPNTLACREWKDILTQLMESKACVDFNQGVDIRLMTEEKAEMISKVKTKKIHFAYDRYQDKKMIEPKFRKFRDVTGWSRNRVLVYVLCNFNTDISMDLDRIMFLRSLNFSPYVMLYNKASLPRGHIMYKLKRWVNFPALFWRFENFDDYLAHEKDTH